jgi:hypothetical protein
MSLSPYPELADKARDLLAHRKTTHLNDDAMASP